MDGNTMYQLLYVCFILMRVNSDGLRVIKSNVTDWRASCVIIIGIWNYAQYHTDPFTCDCIWIVLFFNTWTSLQETELGVRDNKVFSCIFFFSYEDKQSAELVLHLKVVPNFVNDKLKGDRQKNTEKDLRNVVQYAIVRRSDGCRYIMLASSVALK